MLNKPKDLINDDYFIGIDTERYQGVLEHALSKVDFSVGIDIYMLPSNLNLTIGKTKGYKNKILASNTDMKIGTIPHNLKMLTKKHNDEKVAITLSIVGTKGKG